MLDFDSCAKMLLLLWRMTLNSLPVQISPCPMSWPSFIMPAACKLMTTPTKWEPAGDAYTLHPNPQHKTLNQLLRPLSTIFTVRMTRMERNMAAFVIVIVSMRQPRSSIAEGVHIRRAATLVCKHLPLRL